MSGTADRQLLGTLAIVVWAATVTLIALPVPPDPIPVSRLVTVLGERVAKNPDDWQAVFTLGRVHYFAFAGATDVVNALPRGGEVPRLYDFMGEGGKGPAARGPRSATMTRAAQVAHVKEAIAHLSRVAQAAPADFEDGRVELCFACALEEGASFAAEAGAVGGLAPTADAWTAAAILSYGRAFDRAVTRDSSVRDRPAFGLETLVSYEAGRSYARLIRQRGSPPTAEEAARIDRIARASAAMEALSPRIVMPLVFGLDRETPLADLLSTRVVSFDLDGTGRPQQYAWVRRDTAILVWDPARTGRMTSGRQLFGSVTWWLFWDDAYQALDILDDDRNGWIEARELQGLAIWVDRDEDGTSDSGEVTPVEQTPVAALATRATAWDCDAPMNPTGLRLRNGRRLPTYDWIATPAIHNRQSAIPNPQSFNSICNLQSPNLQLQ